MDPEGLDYLYALKCIFNAHAGDVRVLQPTSIPDGGILTGSRDMTIKVWQPSGKSFRECSTFRGASAFISSLCVLPPSAQYPEGLFLAGSHDCSIYGFTLDSREPVIRLMGHSGTVCTLSYGKSGFLVSGSWDKTARVWSGQQCVLTLQGHREAVWATDVFPTQNLILTGSADHTIRLWRQGTCEKVFIGHQDCVRGLAIVTDMKFLSCSNDSTVRLWLTSGDCIQVYKSHNSYIYSISLLSNGLDFTTCGEDQCVKIWRNGACIQTFILASKSLWDVACLSNGDLAIGTSDGKVYVFEKVPQDYFEKTSEHGIASLHSTPSSSASVSGVPDLKSSIYCGESVITYQNKSDHMYVCQFNNVSGTIIKKEILDFQAIEEMFFKKPNNSGSSTSNDHPLMKTDYVFDVDVENVIYKLAFNKGENPWDVAMKFVGEHNLPVEHVGQIVDYIIKNTVISFTNDVYPMKNYSLYQTCNFKGLKEKLMEFRMIMPGDKYVTEEEVEELMVFKEYPEVISIEQMKTLDRLISWSDEYLFPVLDLLRIAVMSQGLRPKISTREFMNHLLHIFMHTNSSVNRTLVEKILCNMFGNDVTEKVLADFQDKILESVKEKFCTGEIKIQKAGAALFLNFAIASYKGFDLNMDRYCSTTMEMFNYVVDVDAVYRMLMAVGTVCTRSTLAVTYFRSVNFKEFILKFKFNNLKTEKIVQLLYTDF